MIRGSMAVLLIVVCAATTACSMPFAGTSHLDIDSLMARQDRSMKTMQQKQKLMQEMMKNPDTPAWHAQRQKIVMAQGDRVFDKNFERVFDSMTVALATLECQVQNMERVSGYITASPPALPPEQRDALRAEAARSYAAAKGFAPELFDKKPTIVANTALFDPEELMDTESVLATLSYGGGVTLSLVRQGPNQTKVKLRFDKIYYPREVQEYYRIIWAAVDKQMFLDRHLD